MRGFRDKLVGGLYEGIYALDGEPLNRVMDTQAESCMRAFVALTEIPPDLSLDDFFERMKTAGPGPVRVERLSEDSLLWTEFHHGECVCPHVRQGAVRLDPKLCLCGETWVRLLIERHSGRHAVAKMVESVATGAENCVYRIELGAPLGAAVKAEAGGTA